MLELIMGFYKKNVSVRPFFALNCLLSALFGFFSSQVSFFGGVYPLGAAVCAALPKGVQSVIAGVGTAAGILLPVPQEDAMRRIASIIIILFLKLLTETVFGSEDPTHSAAWYASLGTGAGALFSIMSSGVDTQKLLFYFAEIVLSLGFAYFISDTAELYSKNKNMRFLGTKDMISVFTFCAVVLCCVNVDIKGVGSSEIFALLLILYCSYFSEEAAAAICSFVLSAVLCVLGGQPERAVLLAACGVAGAVCGGRSKPACITALFTSCILSMSVVKGSAAAILIESIIAGALFIITPKKFGKTLSSALSPRPTLARTDALRRNMVSRMSFAAGALREVSGTVKTAADKLSKINMPVLSSVFEKTHDEHCKYCSLEKHCFVKTKISTYNAFKDICSEYRAGCVPPSDKLPKKWAARCPEPEKVAKCVCNNYAVYLGRLDAERRLEEIRSAVSEQMDSLALTLKDLSVEFDSYEQYDVIRAQKTEAMLRRMGLSPSDVACRLDSFGRMSVDISLRKSEVRTVNKSELLKRVGAACSREFDLPVVTDNGCSTMISFCEKPTYKLDFGVSQHTYKNEKLCGDTYSHFADGKGKYITLLSDGMGCGGRACVDSSMVSGLMSRLLLAGFGFDCALKLVNSAMLFKSSDESLATIDITCVDLYSGKAEFYKAGACDTTIIHGAKSCKASCRNLPAGILRDVDFEKSEVNLSEGDIVIMISDGAAYDDDERIEVIARKMCDRSAQQIAETVLQNVVADRDDGHEDDVTIIIIKLEKER